MSRQTEKTMKELNAFLKAQRPDGPSEEEMNDLIQQFMREKNAQLSLGGEYDEPETADDYLELAEEENSKKKQIEYLNKALELEPDNLDAGRMMAELTAKNPYALMEELSRLLEKGNRQMMKEGYFADEYKGDFWGVIETRPYMRLRHLYMQTLTECGMLRRAARECEELLELCENDNLGVRHDLMHLYAMLEEEEPARAVLEKFPEEETQTLLPLSILHFKLGQTDEALEELKRLSRINKDTKKFLNAMRSDSGKLEKYLWEMSSYGYRPFSIEELIMEVSSYAFLFESAHAYFEWGYQALKKEKAKK
ncbi:MAG: hypothetical protein IKN81_08670 [Oscillospiraceae bacterium]|nr:hypothetical protein [Oscillospiraceae bacterium]